mmetsp:Transcript_9806/g.32814  ORF Transcript_9806/g.32814 Transcript_9806/m.32814 type:complete len:200 (+) Transcript_9806:687-1286(+)
MHEEVRELCMDYLVAERGHFSQFVTQDFDEYVRRKRNDKEFGNNLEMQALSEIYNRPIEVYRGSAVPMKIFHEGYGSGSAPLRLSYHRGNHYNSVIDPKEHTVGVGLGLPGYETRNPVNERIEEEFEKFALRESEADEMEAALLESTLRASRETWEDAEIQKQLDELGFMQSRLEESPYSRMFFQGGGGSGGAAAGRDS